MYQTDVESTFWYQGVDGSNVIGESIQNTPGRVVVKKRNRDSHQIKEDLIVQSYRRIDAHQVKTKSSYKGRQEVGSEKNRIDSDIVLDIDSDFGIFAIGPS